MNEDEELEGSYDHYFEANGLRQLNAAARRGFKFVAVVPGDKDRPSFVLMSKRCTDAVYDRLIGYLRAQ